MLSHSKGSNDSIIVNHNTSSIGIKQPFIPNEKHNYLFNELNITQEDNELSDIDLNDNLKTKIWIENCSSPLSNLQIGDSRVVGGLVPLGIICLVVIIGNMMVMYAVKVTKKLRGATYLFIVSLAWADLMLGLVVLPFSAVYEIFSIWIFGQVWCSIWLAVDVWMCTASILHLVVISLDRYIAVTHPITYPNLMTSKKAKLLIAGAWVISFVVCFPPLVGWNDRSASSAMQDMLKSIIEGNFVNGTSGIYFSRMNSSKTSNYSNRLNSNFPENIFVADLGHSIHKSIISNLSIQSYNKSYSSNFRLHDDESSYIQLVHVAYEIQSILDRCQPKCTLTQEPGYVIYSAVGSFYAPMLVMMFLNWKIYRTALKTTKAIRQGWTKVKGVNGGNGNAAQIGMGIHRGGGIKNEKDSLPKGGSCKINNKKLQNQKTCPNLAAQTAGTNNNLLGVSNNTNDRRLSLNVPLRSSATRQNRSRNSPVVPRQVIPEKNQTEVANKTNKKVTEVANTAIKKNPISNIEDEDAYEIKQITISSKGNFSTNTNQTKEEPLQIASVRINSLSSSKSHSSINAVVDSKDKSSNNSKYVQDYYKTHSMTSLPKQGSLDPVMNHTNLLHSSTNSKRLKKPLNDTTNSVKAIGSENKLESKIVSDLPKIAGSSENKKDIEDKTLNQKSNHIPLNKFNYHRNNQCRHSKRTFSEQATQTDRKSTSTAEDEETNTKLLNNEVSSQKILNTTTNGKCGTNVNKIRLKSLFSKKLTIRDSDEKSIAQNCNKKGPQISTTVHHTPSFDRNNGLGCNSTQEKRNGRTESIMHNPLNENEIEHMLDNSSIDSKRAGDSSKPYLCFQCHPRRWTRRKNKFIRCCWTETSNKKDKRTSMMMSFKRPNHKSGATELSDDALIQSHIDDNGDMSPPNFHSSAEDDIHIYPLTGVAAMINQVVNQTVNITAAATGPQGAVSKPNGRHFGKRNIKSQVRRFRMETKAAKTLGIIIGCFICCWFPFFTIYLTAAFCSDCIPELVFDIFFWLGYCNSALNPFIYAMFSREFRGAFKKIFYKLFCMTYEENVNAHSIVSTFNHRNMEINTAQSSMIANSDHTKGENKSKHNL